MRELPYGDKRYHEEWIAAKLGSAWSCQGDCAIDAREGGMKRVKSAVEWACALASLAAIIATGAVDAASPADTLVITDRGRIEGRIEQGLVTFKGIRYATPPIGALRWREPQPLARWTGTQPAQAFGPSCVQDPSLAIDAGLGDPRPISEDCLFLNVWTPRTGANAKLPVMVWIHGGAFVLGSGSLPIFSGAPLAQRGVVVVTINYRLGALGYFAHPALTQGNAAAAVNFGLFDQIAALQWVKSNIAAFGGDASNITIFGESAGAESVLALLASPLARGLFGKAIAQSPYGIPSHTLASAQEIAANAATALKLNGANATAAELRRIPADAFVGLTGTDLSLAPSLVVGDPALPEPILTAFQRGGEAKVPLIIGSNSDEGSIAAAFGINPATIIERLGAARILVDWLYPSNISDAQLGREVVRDLIFTTFARRIAYLHSARAPTWRYYFSYAPRGLRARRPGVPHGGEIVFTMGTLDLCQCVDAPIDARDRDVARRVSTLWSNFARSGTPSVGTAAAWPIDSRGQAKLLEFSDTDVIRVDFMKERLDVFIATLNALGQFTTPR